MANRCASLDPTRSHLPAPAACPWPHAAWLSPAAAFENDALTFALRASVSPSSSSPSPSSSSASELSTTPHDAPAPLSCRAGQGRQAQTRPVGRVSKRKPRASRRAQTTYINADPANFSRMVQEITGFPVPGADPAFAAAVPAPRPAAAACALPTLDTSAFLLDHAPPPPVREEAKASGGADTMVAAAEAVVDDSSLLLLQELEAMVSSAPVVVTAFPTLESWGMI